MSQCRERTISKRTVDALSVEDRDAIFWDRDLSGFGVRVYPSGRKVYVVQSRGPRGSRRVTLGRHGKITPAQARKRAARDHRQDQDPGRSRCRPSPRRRRGRP